MSWRRTAGGLHGHGNVLMHLGCALNNGQDTTFCVTYVLPQFLKKKRHCEEQPPNPHREGLVMVFPKRWATTVLASQPAASLWGSPASPQGLAAGAALSLPQGPDAPSSAEALLSRVGSLSPRQALAPRGTRCPVRTESFFQVSPDSWISYFAPKSL